MQKNYILDTNILLHNPESLLKFEDNDVYIPHPVVEELDKFKSERGERGFFARTAMRKIQEFRMKGDLMKGVPTEDGGTIHLLYPPMIDYSSLPTGWDKTKPDNIILLTAKWLDRDQIERGKKKPTILVTNDINMQLKADIMGLSVQEYKNDRISDDHEIYSGRSERSVDDEVLDRLSKDGRVPVPESDEFVNLTTNEFITLKGWSGGSMLCRYDGSELVSLYNQKECPHPYGLTPRNQAQYFLQEALLSPHSEHPLTIVNGPAGTGKTLFALACGLEQVTEKNLYKKILVCRANVTLDEDIGALPGSEKEKIDPLLRGIYDNLTVLLGNEGDTPDDIKERIEYFFDKNIIEAEAVAYLRGRSIQDTYFIIDEAQNCTPNQILSIISRCGSGSKVALLGDNMQIDSPRLDQRNNGLIFALERMKGDPLCEICSFFESESVRSPLAKVAAEKLNKTIK